MQKKNILIVSSGGLGDTMLFTLMLPYYQRLLQSNETLTLVTRRGSECLKFMLPSHVSMMTIDYRRFIRNFIYRTKIKRQLQRKRFRVAISTDHLRLPTVDDQLVFACEADYTYAMVPRPWPKHNQALQLNQQRYSKLISVTTEKAHRMTRWTQLINGILDSELQPPRVEFAFQFPRSSQHPYVVIHPFSAVKQRQCTLSLWQKIIDCIPQSHRIILSAGPNDLQQNEAYQQLLEQPRVSLNDASIADKAQLYCAASLVISVDTSMLHLAIGSGCRTIGLVSAAHLVDSVPYPDDITPDNATFLYNSMPCEGCLGKCIHPLEAGNYRCMQWDWQQLKQHISAPFAQAPIESSTPC